jgi:putative transposase
MPRRPRQADYPGATHHVFNRGVARSVVAVDGTDYSHALNLLEQMIARFGLRCHAWCYLPNHFHLLLTSQRGNLSDAMHWLGTCTAAAFNLRHERSGHLYQGRFGSRLVDDDEYLMELARYVPLNPVRAGLCRSPADWPWSSYAATAGLRAPPSFLDAGPILARLGSPADYVAWVSDGIEASRPEEVEHRQQVPLSVVLADGSTTSIVRAHRTYGYSKASIARYLGLSRGQLDRRLAG